MLACCLLLNVILNNYIFPDLSLVHTEEPYTASQIQSSPLGFCKPYELEYLLNWKKVGEFPDEYEPEKKVLAVAKKAENMWFFVDLLLAAWDFLKTKITFFALSLDKFYEKNWFLF